MTGITPPTSGLRAMGALPVYHRATCAANGSATTAQVAARLRLPHHHRRYLVHRCSAQCLLRHALFHHDLSLSPALMSSLRHQAEPWVWLAAHRGWPDGCAARCSCIVRSTASPNRTPSCLAVRLWRRGMQPATAGRSLRNASRQCWRHQPCTTRTFCSRARLQQGIERSASCTCCSTRTIGPTSRPPRLRFGSMALVSAQPKRLAAQRRARAGITRAR